MDREIESRQGILVDKKAISHILHLKYLIFDLSVLIQPSLTKRYVQMHFCMH
jgi:hypothetical protein